jgi:hypothetical protein
MEHFSKFYTRGFYNERGDLYNEITGISGYIPDRKIGDTYLVCTKEELEEADRMLRTAIFALEEEDRIHKQLRNDCKQENAISALEKADKSYKQLYNDWKQGTGIFTERSKSCLDL